MNPNKPPLSRSTINDFLEIPNTLPLNINYKTTYCPTESKNNTSSVTSWILTIANSRLMGNRGAQWRTKEHSEAVWCLWQHTEIPTAAVYLAAGIWDHSSPVYVKSPICKVSRTCKVKDTNISKRLNTGLLDIQSVIQYFSCLPFPCSPTFTTTQSFIFHIQETNAALGSSCCTAGQSPDFTVEISFFTNKQKRNRLPTKWQSKSLAWPLSWRQRLCCWGHSLTRKPTFPRWGCSPEPTHKAGQPLHPVASAAFIFLLGLKSNLPQASPGTTASVNLISQESQAVINTSMPHCFCLMWYRCLLYAPPGDSRGICNVMFAVLRRAFPLREDTRAQWLPLGKKKGQSENEK